ncbi:MAG TPA: RsmD family RNA methyltransferase, partial [Solirubrobacteraceae bacterium]|nr:RsmD family RNA methyltransferase [Solirubrobacteraceae bacterium]
SGALGIEALSRGTESAVFVERDALALRALRANLGSLGLVSPRTYVRERDVLLALQTARRRKETYDLVFIDPPYSQAHGWTEKLAAALPPLLGPAARVVVESDRRAPLRLGLEVERERRYGDTSITIHLHR